MTRQLELRSHLVQLQ
ncbi:hypothetical protein LINPERHAP2_LOCUS12971 [Linum perenne]